MNKEQKNAFENEVENAFSYLDDESEKDESEDVDPQDQPEDDINDEQEGEDDGVQKEDEDEEEGEEEILEDDDEVAGDDESEGDDQAPEDESEKEKTNADHAAERIADRRWKETVEENARLKAQMEMLAKQQEEQKKPEEQKPQENPFDAEIEPESHQMWEDNKKLREEIAGIQESVQYQGLQARKDMADMQASQSNPDYGKQKQFIVEKQAAFLEMQMYSTLKAQHPTATDEQINGYIQQNRSQLVARAAQELDVEIMRSVQANQDVGVIVKGYADRFGYQPEPEKPKQEQKKPDLRKIKENKKRSGSLNKRGNGSGRADSRISSDSVADMTWGEVLSTELNDIDFE